MRRLTKPSTSTLSMQSPCTQYLVLSVPQDPTGPFTSGIRTHIIGSRVTHLLVELYQRRLSTEMEPYSPMLSAMIGAKGTSTTLHKSRTRLCCIRSLGMSVSQDRVRSGNHKYLELWRGNNHEHSSTTSIRFSLLASNVWDGGLSSDFKSLFMEDAW